MCRKSPRPIREVSAQIKFGYQQGFSSEEMMELFEELYERTQETHIVEISVPDYEPQRDHMPHTPLPQVIVVGHEKVLDETLKKHLLNNAKSSTNLLLVETALSRKMKK